MRFFSRGGWLVVFAAMISTGCSSSPTESGSAPPTAADHLLEVAGLLRDHTVEFKKGPAKLSDMAKNEPLYTRGYQAIKSGTVVVVWSVPMPMEGGGEGVIAYEKKAESEGGAVLLQNGKVKSMTADEFRSAPKAK
jgi:hypothetical protein